MSDALEELIRESRHDLGTAESRKVDWAKVDEGLFARIDEERRAERAQLTSAHGRRWTLVAATLAVAAAVALVVGKARDSRSLDAVQETADDGAGSIVGIDGAGEVLIDGRPVAVGAALHLGDVVEARGAQATIDRPGKLTLVVERGSKATVTHVQGALVLALLEGAVEAQVVPVPSGEAFAVDVDRSRVAVHGTHLRVARAGDHVVVDLNEGVVSIGAAPRIGSTLGSLVTAPAHMEFTAAVPEGTLTVSHEGADVRAPLALSTAQTKGAAVAFAPPAQPKLEPSEPHPSAALAAAARGEARPAAPPPATPAAPAIDPDAEGTITGTVRWCMAERPRAENVTVVVNTTLRLELSADGAVRSARFDPPVAPDVNACAVQTIYKTRFAHGGSVAIPIDFRVPSSAP
ncbi:MAG TPA: FecR domain-containing protein [Polyangiaceae bacterium]|jgi:hypothetical protein